MKKKEFLEYFCNYNIKNINVYYYYDINEFFYEIDLINPRTNPIDINDIYFEQEEQFIEFLVKHCKLNNIRYSLLARQNNTYHENSYAIKNKKIDYIVVKQDNKDRLSYYEEPYDFLEQANDIKNKLKISISSRKMLNDAIEIINSYLKDSEIYQILKIYNNYDNDYKVIITLMNNLTIIIKGQYLINILMEYLNYDNVKKSERVITYE